MTQTTWEWNRARSGISHWYGRHTKRALTHWGRDEIDAITQTTFSRAFFLSENVWIPTKISLMFVPKGPINNIPALVQIMDWRRPGDKPLSEPMMVSLLTHICVTRPQWVNIIAYFVYKLFQNNWWKLHFWVKKMTIYISVDIDYVVWSEESTVRSKKYAHSLHLIMFCWENNPTNFNHIIQINSTTLGLQLPQHQRIYCRKCG